MAMEDSRTQLREALEHLDPSYLDYEQWSQVGMALKHEGLDVYDWERWSQKDTARYREGECARKWESFRGSNNPVTGASVVSLARAQGFSSSGASEGRALTWDDVIGGGKDELAVLDPAWVESRDVIEPLKWDPVAEVVTYLQTLFSSEETVGYVTGSWEKDGRHMPQKGVYTRTAGELINELQKAKKGDVGAVLGDYQEEAGAWIRFNPLDGSGVKNDNVTEFRYALVESDTMEIDKQNAIIRELELPVAALVHSGSKSLHAIVRIDAMNYEEYRTRVDFLYDVCKKNGLAIDVQNKNPSRLSRLPGIMRNGRKQFLLDTNIGHGTWNEWKDWVEKVNDDLPDPESLDTVWDTLPELSPPLIDGVLRQGHKMMLAGPSKAGKSFSLIELCVGIAEGEKWLGWACTQGRVLYVNLELDRASCLHRFKDVYREMAIKPDHLKNIDIWNLRGKAVPMDKLAPKLIRRAAKKNYIAIIIDPIYKVITGDENSADQMAKFSNQFDLVCNELGSAVIYCHHHSKGSQGQKRSADRASGSGVFARDPDTLLDLIELELTDDVRKQQVSSELAYAMREFMDTKGPNDWRDRISQDVRVVGEQFYEAADKIVNPKLHNELHAVATEARKRAHGRTGWRIEGTLREFPRFDPLNLWFDYPTHKVDTMGVLADLKTDGEMPPWEKGTQKIKKNAEKRKKSYKQEFEKALEMLSLNGTPATRKAVAEYLDVEPDTLRKRMGNWKEYAINEDAGYVIERVNNDD